LQSPQIPTGGTFTGLDIDPTGRTRDLIGRYMMRKGQEKNEDKVEQLHDGLNWCGKVNSEWICAVSLTLLASSSSRQPDSIL
jgi:hypothetical protein